MVYKQYENPETLRAIQVLCTFILEEIDRVCKILDIHYFAYAGTALGSVRHQGFIPWDDDADVALLRDDYERFIREAPKHLREPFIIQDVHNTKNWSSISSCLAIKGITFVPANINPITSHKYLGVDLFALDALDNNLRKRKKQLRSCFFWGRIIYIRATPRPFIPYRGLKKFAIHSACTCIHLLLRLCRIDASKIYAYWKKSSTAAYAELEEAKAAIIHKTGESSEQTTDPQKSAHPTVADFTDQHPLVWSMSLDEIFPLGQGTFEWLQVPLPCKLDSILTRNYGNYRELPPVEKRKTHYPAKLDFGPFDVQKLASEDLAVARQAFEEGVLKLQEEALTH